MGKVKVGDYSWEKVAQQVMNYYQELLKGRSGVISEEISTACQGTAFLDSAR